jgi:hypothetical protein
MGGDWLTFVVVCMNAQVTHLNSKAIINKDRLLHHHLCINSNLRQEEEEEEAGALKAGMFYLCSIKSHFHIQTNSNPETQMS